MRALAAIETNSVAQGFYLADEAVKTADVDLLEATAICAGKFLAIVTGSPAAVRAAMEASRLAAAPGLLFQELYLARVHGSVFRALCGSPPELEAALGVFESYSAINALEMADHVAKRCPVTLLEIRLGRGLGGKSCVSFCGEQAGVEEAAAYVRREARGRGLFSDAVVIANPSAAACQASVPHGPGHKACSTCLEG